MKPLVHRHVVLAVIGLSLGAAQAHADTAKKILYLGNSFTLNENVPNLVAEIASSAGKAWPQYVTDLKDSTDFDYHIDQLRGPSAWKLTSMNYDFVVLQDLSTEPTRIGDPADFRRDAVTLTQMVRKTSPKAVPILEQTWAYQPQNKEMYPKNFPNAVAMNNDLATNTWLGAGDIDKAIGGGTREAPVGDIFRTLNFSPDLYQSYDWKHPSHRGGVLAALTLYAKMYGDNVSDIPFNSAKWWLTPLAIDSSTWTSLTSATDRYLFGKVSTIKAANALVAPEPASVFVLSTLSIGLLKRRHRSPRR